MLCVFARGLEFLLLWTHKPECPLGRSGRLIYDRRAFGAGGTAPGKAGAASLAYSTPYKETGHILAGRYR